MPRERFTYWMVSGGSIDGPAPDVAAAVECAVRRYGPREALDTYCTDWWVEGWAEEWNSDTAEWLGVWELPVCDSQIRDALSELQPKRATERLHTLKLETLSGELGCIRYWAVLGDWTDSERKARQYLLQVAPYVGVDWLLHSVTREEVVR